MCVRIRRMGYERAMVMEGDGERERERDEERLVEKAKGTPKLVQNLGREGKTKKNLLPVRCTHWKSTVAAKRRPTRRDLFMMSFSCVPCVKSYI